MKFFYEAFDSRGQATTGEIEAGSEEEAAGMLRSERGLFVRELNPEKFQPKLEGSKAVNISKESKPHTPEAEVETAPSESKVTKAPAKKVADEIDSKVARVMASDLKEISKVARIMDTWHKQYKEGSPGPAVGGKTWRAYDENRFQIVANLIEKAMLKATGIEE